MGYRSAPVRRGGSRLVAGTGAARPCARPPRMAWTDRYHCRARRALCTGDGRRAELCTRLRPSRAQSGLHAAVRRSDRRGRSGREAFDHAKVGALTDTGRRCRHRSLARSSLERRLEHLLEFWRCAFPRCSILVGMLHRGHAAGAQLPSLALRAQPPLGLWCRRRRHCSQFRSLGNGQTRQIGSASS
jgi:hypothetical protein